MDRTEIWEVVGDIAVSYPLMECDRCAIAIMTWLNQNQIPGTILRLRTQRKRELFIVSQRHGMHESITENGIHYGVNVLGLVFDNLSAYGLSKEEWIADFRCPSGKFLIDELDLDEMNK